MKKYLWDLYIRKDLILYLVASGLKAEHRNSFLGYIWWLLDPLLGAFIFYFIVVVVFRRGGEGYGIFLVIGMVVWRWLNSSVAAASRSIVAQSSIITQVYLPKAIFPLGSTISQLINFGFGIIVIFAVTKANTVPSGWIWTRQIRRFSWPLVPYFCLPSYICCRLIRRHRVPRLRHTKFIDF